jgi:hypothetical protein
LPRRTRGVRPMSCVMSSAIFGCESSTMLGAMIAPAARRAGACPAALSLKFTVRRHKFNADILLER